MTITLVRNDCTDTRTLGTLTFPDGFECQTLEDPFHKIKIPGETCIPNGIYRVTITRSQRFERMLPLVHDVPEFTGIRIHAGNTTKDTSGCILVGMERDGDQIIRSREAMMEVQHRIAEALTDATGICRIEILRPRVTTEETFAVPI